MGRIGKKCKMGNKGIEKGRNKVWTVSKMSANVVVHLPY